MKNLDAINEIAYAIFKRNPKTIYTPSQVKIMMASIKNGIKLGKMEILINKLEKKVTIKQMIENLESAKRINKTEFSFPSKKYTRYTWGEKSIYNLLSSLEKNAYYSHLSALYFHKLLNNDNINIYLNIEQSPKPGYHNRLIQEDINRAFLRAPKTTNNVINYKQKNIYLLNGMYTNKLGVINISGPKKENVFVTDIERTLIDIAVRPQYSGGVSNVLNVYRRVIKNLSIEKIVKMLKKLNYTYPYHQAIGFYLAKAGLTHVSTIFRKKFRIEFDFYLTHQMDKPEYSEKWRIFYPKDLLKISDK